ncbi:UvrD-helicase domain-containing protein, partial [Klebsiella pneumoniae]
LLVDEMQDTNPLQWALLQPLIGKVKLFCVGDDAQSIYGFRGADFENIHSFKERIPDAVIHTLDLNYRSTQEILDLSNWLLAHSPIDYQKQLQAHRGKGQKPQLHLFGNEFEEANWIAQDLIER